MGPRRHVSPRGQLGEAVKLTLLAVGRMKACSEGDLVDDYMKRLGASARSLGFRDVSEIEVASGGGMAAEGERLLAKCSSGARLIRLDEHGKALTSKALAHNLAKWRDAGIPERVFLIGGAEGYSEAVKQAVPETLALGPQTWPHRLVRVMIAEQLYRAVSILGGTPYHKA